MNIGHTLHMPHKPGMRTIKTALAAALCAFFYYFWGRSPAFACIGAIFGMGTGTEDGYRNGGGNRLYGTILGGLLGMALFRLYLVFVPDGHHTLLLTGFTFVGVVLLVMLCQVFWLGGVQPGGVVLCILLFNTPVETYVSYALNRIFDTTIGVFAALAVSWLIPRGGMKTWRERIARWRANYHAGAHGYYPDHHEAPDVEHVEALMEAAREEESVQTQEDTVEEQETLAASESSQG